MPGQQGSSWLSSRGRAGGRGLLTRARRCLRVRLLDLRPALRAVRETTKTPRVRMARSDPLRSGKDEPAAATGQRGTGASVKNLAPGHQAGGCRPGPTSAREPDCRVAQGPLELPWWVMVLQIPLWI